MLIHWGLLDVLRIQFSILMPLSSEKRKKKDDNQQNSIRREKKKFTTAIGELTNMKFGAKFCSWNLIISNVLLQLQDFLIVKYRTIWDSIQAPLHILHNNTATMICISCFNLTKMYHMISIISHSTYTKHKKTLKKRENQTVTYFTE